MSAAASETRDGACTAKNRSQGAGTDAGCNDVQKLMAAHSLLGVDLAESDGTGRNDSQLEW